MPSLLRAGAGGALQIWTRNLLQGTNLPCPTALPSLPAQESCRRDWTRVWRGEGWQDQAFTASGRHHRAVEPQVLLVPRRERGSGLPARLGHFLTGIPCRRCLGHIPKEQRPLLAIEPMDVTRLRHSNAHAARILSPLRHESLIILNN